MITSIVMINSEVGKVNSVAEKLVDMDGVGKVHSISGEAMIVFLSAAIDDSGVRPAEAKAIRLPFPGTPVGLPLCKEAVF